MTKATPRRAKSDLLSIAAAAVLPPDLLLFLSYHGRMVDPFGPCPGDRGTRRAARRLRPVWPGLRSSPHRRPACALDRARGRHQRKWRFAREALGFVFERLK